MRIGKGRNLEIIIQDALSTDTTQEIIEDYIPKFKDIHYHRENDFGQSDAINKGIMKAQGKWVTWLCSDDLLLDGFIDLLRDIEFDKEVSVIYGDCVFLKDNKLTPAIGTGKYEKGKLLKRGGFIQQPGTCIVKSEWVKVKGLDTKLNWIMDYDLFVRLEEAGCFFRRLDTFVSVARIHDEAKTSSGSFRRFAEYFVLFAGGHKRNLRFFSIKPYTIYFVEYIIKNMESKKRKGLFYNALVAIFWKMVRPREKTEIIERFNSRRKGIQENIDQLEGIPI